jgi:tetratricopeptide (TPR) repeat protein
MVLERQPDTPRDYYNAGTRKFAERKYREAEALLETALASQSEPLQPPALYNLGHVRYAQGLDELKKGPSPAGTAAAGLSAGQSATDAVRIAEEALASEQVRAMVAAYMRGRGTRRELKAATQAVKQALQAHGNTLSKWQRASGDFHSAVDLNPADRDARNNAYVVDRSIARLVDSMRQLQEMANALGQKMEELREKMRQLRGKIPEEDMPPGAAGDDEEEDQPFGPQEGQQEQGGREGEEITLTPEQAGWLLEGFKLDKERRLPMGQKETGEPKQRNRPTW